MTQTAGLKYELEGPTMSELVARAQRGDPGAMQALLTKLAPSVHRFGARMCSSSADAEDVVQDTMLAIATHLRGFEGRAALTSWVFSLARSACTRRRRGLRNKPALGDELLVDHPDAAPDPEHRATQNELGEALHRALGALSEEHREVIQLRDVEGLTAPETADALGISVDATKSRLHRARAALKAALAPLVGAERPNPGCPDVVRLWSRKLEGELSGIDCASMEAHMKGCTACASACDGLRSALVACQRASTSTVPPAVATRVRLAFEAWLAAPQR